MGSKTPVSILQEMMARIGTLPKYDLILDGSGTHIATFKYKVYASNVTAIGTGRSKKEAKHEAARIALEKLALHQIEDVQPAGVPPEPAVEVVTPYKDKIQENAVGQLHLMCCTHEIPLPDYLLIEEKGAPHEKLFTYVCCVSKQKEIGTGRTKKQAKQLAAFNMMNRLKDSLSEVLKDVEEEESPEPNDNLERTGAKYMAAIGTPRKRVRLNRGLSTYHEFFVDTSGDSIQQGKELLSSIDLPEWGNNKPDCWPNENEPKEADPDWMEVLKDIAEAMKIEIKLVPSKCAKNGNQVMFIQIARTSDAVFYGSSQTLEDAVQNAALYGLRFLKIQLCGGLEEDENVKDIEMEKEKENGNENENEINMF